MSDQNMNGEKNKLTVSDNNILHSKRFLESPDSILENKTRKTYMLRSMSLPCVIRDGTKIKIYGLNKFNEKNSEKILDNLLDEVSDIESD